jgi:hypothetical protein
VTATATATLPRCPFRGCIVRYRDGTDRPCAEHRNDSDGLAARLAEYEALAAAPAPGDRDDASSGEMTAR